MAAASTIQLRGSISALPEGSVSIAPTDLSNTNAPFAVTQLSLASGANTIAIPTNALGVLIIFDPTSTVAKTLKGVTGDTGILLTKSKWMILTFDSPPPADFVITSASADTGKITAFRFF